MLIPAFHIELGERVQFEQSGPIVSIVVSAGGHAFRDDVNTDGVSRFTAVDRILLAIESAQKRVRHAKINSRP